MKIDKSQCGNTLAFYVYVGKDLSNSDKVELGGAGSVIPPEWDPDDSNNSDRQLSISDRRSVHSLREQVRLHEEKLTAYKRNPDAFDNLGHLKNAPNTIADKKLLTVGLGIENTKLKYLKKI
ncbi:MULTISPECIES: hypothetical protein [Providencia]|nr:MULTISPECIES: hypothetical protein [Providencia]MBP6121735.1 hypothetical protein [Providencia sp.]NIH22021.1 hypothetical protein [Providencia heimbachae]